MANPFEPFEMKRRNLSPERQKNAEAARRRLLAPWQRDVRDTASGPKSIRSELEANLKQFTDEFKGGAAFLSRWATTKGPKVHPRIDQTIEDTAARVNTLIDRVVPHAEKLHQDAQAGHAWVNQWVGGKARELSPVVGRGFNTLTDRARPLLAGLQNQASTNTTLAISWARAKYKQHQPGVSKVAFRAIDKVKDTASKVGGQGNAGLSKLSKSYPRLGEGIGTARRGIGIAKDLLAPTVQAVQYEAQANLIGARLWGKQKFGTLSSANISDISVAFKDKVALGAAEMAYRFRHLGPVQRWGTLGIGAIAAGAWLWGSSQSREGPTSNIPPNYIPGQQVQEKILDVPWSSPWSGPHYDGQRAVRALRYNRTGIVGGIRLRRYNEGLPTIGQNTAFRQRRMSRKRRINLPFLYITGQQASSKAIQVPWASPYQGSEGDEATAYNNNILRLTPLFIPSVAQKLYGKMGTKWQQNLYVATRFLEDATPARVGRIFGLSNKFSSFLTPPEINVGINRLLGGANRLTPYGGTFARAMNMTQSQLSEMLQQRLEAGETALKFIKNKTPFMKLEGSHVALRFYESTGRFGISFANYGAAEASITPLMRGSLVETRMRQMLGYSAEGAKGHLFTGRLRDWRSVFFRFLHDKVPGGKAYLERFASIPKWDKNAIKWMQRVGLEEDIWTPGYMSGRAGAKRMMGGVLYNYMSSAWSLLRKGGAAIGVNVGPATSLRTMVKKSSKFGLMAAAGIGAFSYVNETLHGALTAPFWNVYERGRLFQARVSDRLGFTDIRKQHPKVFPWSAAAIVTLPLFALSMAKYFRRVGVANVKEGLGTLERLRLGKSVQWRRGDTMPLREIPFSRASLRIETKIARSSLITKKVLDPRTGKRVRELTTLARVGPAALLGITAALFAPFILGTKYSEQEYADIFSGKKPVPIKRGRFWEFGNTPYEGGRLAYFRMHQAARRKLDAEQEVPGSGRRSILKFLRDPYWREKESYATRPYPITQTPFEEVPFIGPILARTLGRFFKPPKLMHTAEWRAGQAYEPYGADVAPSKELGGLRAPTPKDPLGWRSQVRESVYRTTEFMGLRGFFFQSMLFEHAFGGQAPYAKAHTLQPARFKSFTKHWYDAELGGMGGTNELFRRLYPRPQRGVEVNPLQNQMPRWMPGSDYFVNFKEGDPYNKIPYGEERLPGPGFETKYPQLKGLNPEQYPSWAKFEILADVAPWSVQTRIQRSAAYKDFGNDPNLRAHLEEIDWQMEQVKRKKEFANYDFNRDTETVSGRVSEILPTGEFRLEQYPSHLFKPAGLSFGVAATSKMLRNINGLTKEKADQRAFEQSGEAQQFMADELLGRSVKLKIPVGGMNRPDVSARIFSGGMNFNRELARRGLAAPEGEAAPTAGLAQRLYGRMIEGIGHIPQKVPGPFFLFSKLYNQADPIEEYQRSQLYGSSSRMWNRPFENFIRPYFLQTMAKLTPGEFVPRHTQKRRDVDMLFDRLDFMKSIQNGGNGGRTAVGMNVMGAEQVVTSAMPHRERPYMQEFVKETDPRRRERILAMVSADMQRALLGQWTKQYAEASGQPIPASNPSARMNAAMTLAQTQVAEAGYKMPDKSWVGWNKQTDMEDVKAIFLRSEGYDTHDFNIWDDRTVSLERKPYLKGSHEYLLSRPLDMNINILSSRQDRRQRGLSLVSQHTSRSMEGKLTVYNSSDRKSQDEAAYLEARDSLLTS